MKRLICLMVLFLGTVFSSTAFANSASVSDVNNAMCIVSGEKVSGKHFAEFEGKRYGLCCPGCIKKFNKNPEKYVKAFNVADGSAQESENENADADDDGHEDHEQHESHDDND